MFDPTNREKYCIAYCGDGVCDCGLADDSNYYVDYPCDVEPPYDDVESETDGNDDTHANDNRSDYQPSSS